MVEQGVDPITAIRTVGPRSRDNARTPYQWNAAENAGFTTGKPWIKVNPAYKEINLEADRESPNSIFAWYQKLIGLRKTHPAILDGSLEFCDADSPQVLAYTRNCPEETLLVIANKSDAEAEFALPEELAKRPWQPVARNLPGDFPAPEATAKPWECRIYKA